MGGGGSICRLTLTRSSPIRWHPLAPTLLGFWAATGQPRSPGRRRGREGARGRETARPKRFARTLRPPLVSHVPCPMPMLIPSHPIPSSSTTQHNSNSSFSQPVSQVRSLHPASFCHLGLQVLRPLFCESSPMGAQRDSLVSVR